MNENVTAGSIPYVIVIDDNPDDLFLTRRSIATAGITYPIIEFDNPQSAFDFMRAGTNVRAVFCDIRMPEVSGFDFLKWARDDRRFDSVRVLMLSSSELPEDVDRAEKMGANGYIIKSSPPSLLAEAVNRTEHHFLAPRLMIS